MYFTHVLLITAGFLQHCHGYPRSTTVSVTTEDGNFTDHTPTPTQRDSFHLNTTVSTGTVNVSEQTTTREAAILTSSTASTKEDVITETSDRKNLTLHPLFYRPCQQNKSYCNDHGECFESYDQRVKFCRCDKSYSGRTCDVEDKSKVFEKLLFGIGILCLLFLIILLIIANQLHQKVCEYENFKIEVEQQKKEREKAKEQSAPKPSKPLKTKAFKKTKLPIKKTFKRTITGRKPKSAYKCFPKYFPDQMPVIVEAESAESSPIIRSRFHHGDNEKEQTAYDDASLSSALPVNEPDALAKKISCDENNCDGDSITQNVTPSVEYNPRSYILDKQSSGHTSKDNLESSCDTDLNENSWSFLENSLYNSIVHQPPESATLNNQIVVTAQIHDSPV